VRRTFGNRGVRLASLGYFGHMWELYAVWAWVHVFFTHVAAGSSADRARLGALAAFAIVGIGAAGCYVGGRLGDTWGRTRVTATAMGVSGACALTIGFLTASPTWLVVVVGLVWGFAVVADSAQFSTMVTELADQAYVGTALTLQLALGFTLTVVTIWLIPVVERAHGWGWAFALLAPGPALGLLAMLRLKGLPEARQLAGGRG
jgi:MFS family permease